MKRYLKTILSVLLTASLYGSTAQALNIEYTISGSVNQAQQNAFDLAISNWEQALHDPVTVYMDFSFESMGPDIIGGTWPSLWYAGFLNEESFTGVLSSLQQDNTSAADSTAMNYLNTLETNDPFLYWYSNGIKYGSNAVVATSANLKALGYTGFSNYDATMKFNTDFAFDYDPGNGITQGQMDFVGVATHEIGHVLGFVSIVDYNAYYERHSNPYPPTMLDLYRHTDQYGAGIIDISFDGSNAYFSHDLGATLIDMADGINSPGKRQASHWADNNNLGIMDPTAAYGEPLSIKANDLLAMDLIGWDVTNPVPEPSVLLLLGNGLLGLAALRRRNTKS